MDNATVLIIALAAVAIGVVAGYMLTRSLHPQAKQRRELADKLQQALEEQKQYQHDVTQHFMTTAELVNNLTESYRGLHEHLASSAMHLTNPEVSRQLIDAGYGPLSNDAQPTLIDPSKMPTPPKDYAPKVPGGILSEDYGLLEDSPKSKAFIDAANNIPVIDDDLDDDPTLKVG